jgi:hypothetical protein
MNPPPPPPQAPFPNRFAGNQQTRLSCQTNGKSVSTPICILIGWLSNSLLFLRYGFDDVKN